MFKFLLRTAWATLPLGIYLSFLSLGIYYLKLSFPKIKSSVKIGYLVGIIISIILFLIKALTVWLNKEYLTIVINTLAIFAELCLLLGLFKMRSQKVSQFWNSFFVIAIGWLSSVAILLYLTDVFLVFLQIHVQGEAFFTTDTLFKVIGCVLALAIISTCFYCINKLHAYISEKSAIKWLTIFIILQLPLQFPAIIQPLLARRLIPSFSWLFKYIVFMANNSKYFQIFFLCLLLFLVISCLIRSLKTSVAGKNPAEMRRKKALLRNMRRYSFVVIVSIFGIFSILYFVEGHLSKEVELSPAEEKTIIGFQIFIPVAQVKDNHLHRFEYTTSENVTMRFIIVQKSETSFGVGLDACDICGATGYYERNDEIVCKLCDVVMNRSTIGFKGGCNPVPLNYQIKDNQIVIETVDLDAEQKRFE